MVSPIIGLLPVLFFACAVSQSRASDEPSTAAAVNQTDRQPQTSAEAFLTDITDGQDVVTTARGKMMKAMMNPYFLIPQLIMMGFAPIILANLKMLVMKALMMNNMALSAALFMTIRSLVFGPSPGPQLKYVNYGYKEPPYHHHHHHFPSRD